MTNKEKVAAVLKQHPTWGKRRIAKESGVPLDSVKDALSNMERPAPTHADIDQYILAALRRHSITHGDLAAGLRVPISEISASVERLRTACYNVNQIGTHLSLSKPCFERIPLAIVDGGGWVRVGLVADTHLASKEAREDALHLQYDLFQREGITTVLHAGNLIDGHIPGLNTESVIVASVDGQTQYACDNYPARKGITTYFITGDDHEAWFMKQGLNWGAYMQMVAERNGRQDLKYVGHVEADIEFFTEGGASTILKLQHPGGGSSYARSYKAQKQVESFQGGEKPAILVQGHYHVAGYVFDRNVHVIGMPGFQDQTIFARKKQLRMEIGGVLLEFKQNPEDGAVTRFRPEFNMFFDRGYYRPFLKSDSKLVKGHLKIQAK